MKTTILLVGLFCISAFSDTNHYICSKGLVHAYDWYEPTDSVIWPVLASYEAGVQKEYQDVGEDMDTLTDAFRRLRMIIEEIEAKTAHLDQEDLISDWMGVCAGGRVRCALILDKPEKQELTLTDFERLSLTNVSYSGKRLMYCKWNATWFPEEGYGNWKYVRGNQNGIR